MNALTPEQLEQRKKTNIKIFKFFGALLVIMIISIIIIDPSSEPLTIEQQIEKAVHDSEPHLSITDLSVTKHISNDSYRVSVKIAEPVIKDQLTQASLIEGSISQIFSAIYSEGLPAWEVAISTTRGNYMAPSYQAWLKPEQLTGFNWEQSDSVITTILLPSIYRTNAIIADELKPAVHQLHNKFTPHETLKL